MKRCPLIGETSSALHNGMKITKKKLLSIPSIRRNPISERLIDVFIKNGELDFEQLLKELHQFVSNASLDSKIELLFKVYDRSGRGRISENDLFCTLKTMNNHSLEDSKLWNIVDKTFAELGEYTEEMDLEAFSGLILRKTKDFAAFFKTKE